MNTTPSATGRFTGGHMLAGIMAFFAVIITANVTMAVLASTSWTGLVVPNSYVASQEFNRKADEARAQAALGWTARLAIAGGRVDLALLDTDGQILRAARGGRIVFRRPAYEAEDATVDLTPLPDGVLGGRQSLRDGLWIADITVDAGRERPYRELRRIVVTKGSLQ